MTLLMRLNGTFTWKTDAERCSLKAEGAMAILGRQMKVLSFAEQICYSGQGSVDAANYNAQGQVVIAGDAALVQQVMAEAKEQSQVKSDCIACFCFHIVL